MQPEAGAAELAQFALHSTDREAHHAARLAQADATRQVVEERHVAPGFAVAAVVPKRLRGEADEAVATLVSLHRPGTACGLVVALSQIPPPLGLVVRNAE